MRNYIVTVFDGKKELPLLGLLAGESVNLEAYKCRCIHPQDWQKFKSQFSSGIFDPEITYFLDIGYEIRIYRAKNDNK